MSRGGGNGAVGLDAGGHYVEWYRDDDIDDGHGDNGEGSRWYGSRAECERLAMGPRTSDATPWRPCVWTPSFDECRALEACAP